MSNKQALIFGASGIAGWAFTRECLVYPAANTFDRVIALSYRTLDKNYFTFDTNSSYDDSKLQAELSRLDVYDGIDLSNNSVLEKIANIPDIEKITHVFYSAYAGHEEAYGSSNPFDSLIKVNLALLETALVAITKSCPKLEFWLQISGTKSYGFELDGLPNFPAIAPSLPWKETDLPLPAPFGHMIFYNAQHAELTHHSEGESWKFAELIANMIIGFCPRLNAMSWAQPLALFLSFYKEHSPSTKISWPGTEAGYTCLIADSSQDITARAAIHISLNTRESGQRINISDLEKPISTQTLWQETCAYFGLQGTGPNANSVINTKWLLDRKSDWPAFELKHGLKQGIMEATPWSTLQLMFDINFPRYLDLGAVRKEGFCESQDHFVGYEIAFERLRAARFLP